jgi:outer membrane protein OmpA-like peptidoglycan-associated protein
MIRHYLLAICIAAATLVAFQATAQETTTDAGPPYTMKVIDLVFRVENTAGAIQDLEVKETPTEVTIELAADVLFDFDKSDLLPKAQDTLQKAADVIKERASGKATVRIGGHTDAKGSDSYNQSLSLRRADSVKHWFTSHGLGNLQFATSGFGAKQPVAPNTKPDGSDDPEGRAKNRRVEIVISK